jgi:hypothetical protein
VRSALRRAGTELSHDGESEPCMQTGVSMRVYSEVTLSSGLMRALAVGLGDGGTDSNDGPIPNFRIGAHAVPLLVPPAA